MLLPESSAKLKAPFRHMDEIDVSYS